MTVDPKERYYINSILRGCAILQRLAEAPEPQKIGDLARRMGLDRSTVYRIALSLEKCRMIEKDEPSRGYHLGPAAYEIGSAFLHRTDLHSVSRPIMLELSQRVGETVHLAVLNGHQAIYLDKIDRPGGLGMISQIGSPVILHCTGVGKVLLAFQAPSIREELLDSIEYTRFTENTITTKAALEAELEEIATRGYGLDRVEHEDQVACVAVPVFNHAAEPVAALSVSGSSKRMLNPGEQPAIIREILAAGRKISIKLGHIPSMKEQ